MAAEGTFPKVDGDVLYASEVNKFRMNEFIAAGSTITVQSGAGVQELGSVVINKSGLSIPCCLNIYYKTIENAGENARTEFQIMISGANGNSTISCGSRTTSPGADYDHFGTINCVLNVGTGFYIRHVNDGIAGAFNQTVDTMTWFTGSNIAIRFQARNASSGTTWDAGFSDYFIQMDRGAY
jgi:hypothetical protein